MSDSHVYVRSKEHHWVPARVVGDAADATDRLVVSVPRYTNEQSILSDGGKGATSYERLTIDLNDYPNKVLPLQNVNEIGFLNEEGDMVDLPFLHEVRNLIGFQVRNNQFDRDVRVISQKMSTFFIYRQRYYTI